MTVLKVQDSGNNPAPMVAISELPDGTWVKYANLIYIINKYFNGGVAGFSINGQDIINIDNDDTNYEILHNVTVTIGGK